MADDDTDKLQAADKSSPAKEDVASRRSDGDLRLFDSGYFADAEVTFRDKTWRLHKVILCSRSQWFAKAFEGPWAESQTGKVTIDDSDWEEAKLEQFLRYIYAGGITERDLGEEESPFQACVEIWYLAEYFQVDSLMKDLKSFLEAQCRSFAITLSTFRAMNKNKQQPLTAQISRYEYVPCDVELQRRKLSGGLFAAYRYPVANPLRQILYELVISCGYRIFPNDTLEDLCAALPDLGRDLLPSFIEGTHCREDPEIVLQKARNLVLLDGDKFRCVGCRKSFTYPKLVSASQVSALVNADSIGGFMMCYSCRRDRGIKSLIS